MVESLIYAEEGEEETFKSKNHSVELYMSPHTFDVFWCKLVKDEFEKSNNKHLETGESAIHTPGETDSDEAKSSLQEE